MPAVDVLVGRDRIRAWTKDVEDKFPWPASSRRGIRSRRCSLSGRQCSHRFRQGSFVTTSRNDKSRRHYCHFAQDGITAHSSRDEGAVGNQRLATNTSITDNADAVA